MNTARVGLIYAFRAPLLYLFIFLLIAGSLDRIGLVLFLNQFADRDLALWVDRWCIDYFLYPPNSVVHLLGLALGVVLLECKKAAFPQSRGWRGDAATLGFCLLMALVPALLSVRTTRQWLLHFTVFFQIVLFFLFFSANAGLYFFSRYISRKTWFRRLTTATFPVSDLFFYMYHRDQTPRGVGKSRYVPTTLGLGVLLLIILMNANVVSSAAFAEKLSIGNGAPIDDSYWAKWEGDTVWISTASWEDPDAGVWWYDENTKQSGLYLRVFDMNRFLLEDDFLYVYDRNRNRIRDGKDGCLLKISRKSKEVVWRVPLKHSWTYELTGNEENLLAVGEGGANYLVNKKDGRILSFLQTPDKSEDVQLLSNGDVISLNGNPSVFRYDSSLKLRTEYLLPPLIGRDISSYYRYGHGMRRVATWTEYLPETERLYVSAIWGEVFSLDLASGKWLGSVQVSPGARSFAVDEKNGLLFAANYTRGVIEIRDLVTGALLRNILAGAFSRFINLNPEKRIGILNTKGRGVFRFDYSALVSQPKS